MICHLCEKQIRGLEFSVECKTNRIENLTKELKELKKEKEGFDSKLTGFKSASKDLDKLLKSQRSDKNNEGLGYSAAFTAIDSTSDDLQNKNPSETGASDSTILSKPAIKFVKEVNRPTENKTDKVKTVKKPVVQYVELYRKTSKKSNDRWGVMWRGYECQGWSMVLARVMWRLFVVVGARGILKDQERRCGHFKDQEMDCGACKNLVGEGGVSLRVMWRLFVVVGARGILKDQERRCGHFKDQEMDCGACKNLVGEGEFMIITGADNYPPMLEKSLYDSWKSQDGTSRTKKYVEHLDAEKLQVNYDLKATNIVFQGLPPNMDQVNIFAKDKGFRHEMHKSEESEAVYGVSPPKNYAVRYYNEEMSHHSLYGVKLLLLYATTYKSTKDDLSESALRRNIGDKENVIVPLVVKWLDDVDINTLTLEQYLAWVQDDIRPGVVKPKIRNDVEFEINSNFMSELRRKRFKGLVTTWDLHEKAFIRQYCPPFKTAKKLEINHNFKQKMDETLYHAWERTREIVCMIGNSKEIHNMKAQKDDGDMDVVHITPPDYVASTTNPILNKQLNESRDEFFDITKVARKTNGDPVNNVKELSDIKTYDFETIIWKLLHQVLAARRLKSRLTSTRICVVNLAAVAVVTA
nr:hypothetical protein [Tanacetum cinerariifolium]